MSYRRDNIRFDIAEICLNGHVTNDSVRFDPQGCKAFCESCGSGTIQKCTNCNEPIRGYEHNTGVAFPYYAPSYCIHCGKPFPWIKSKLDAALELASIVDDFSEDDRRILSENLDDIVRDTPRTQVAAIKFKKVLSKTSEGIVSTFREILVDVLSEAAKKALWPGK